MSISSNNNLDLIIVLLISFGLLVTSAIAGVFIAYPLLIALFLFVVVLRQRGFSARLLARMALTGAHQSLPVVNVLLLIGIITAVWMAAGTVPALVYYGTGLISPRFFILWAFILTGLLSSLIGTSFGAVGTLGVALMVMARSGDVAVNPVAGAIIAGAFVGDRCSPMSSSAHLVASITQTSLHTNLRNMLRSSLWPMTLSLFFYALLSLFHPAQLTASPITAELSQAFDLAPVVLLPAGAILLLAALRIEVKIAMLVSIGLGFAIAHHVQNYAFSTLVRFTLFGYQHNSSPTLQPILIGGGLVPMAKATLVVLISTAFAGIFAGSRTLSFVDAWFKDVRTQRQLSWATISIAVLANLFGCTQTIGILLTEQVMRPYYTAFETLPDMTSNRTSDKAFDRNSADEKLAIALEDTAVVIAPLIPWNIAGLIPATVLAVGPGFIPYTGYLLLLPLFLAFRPIKPILEQRSALSDAAMLGRNK